MAKQTITNKFKGVVTWSPISVKITEEDKELGKLVYELMELFENLNGSEVEITVKETVLLGSQVGEEVDI